LRLDGRVRVGHAVLIDGDVEQFGCRIEDGLGLRFLVDAALRDEGDLAARSQHRCAQQRDGERQNSDATWLHHFHGGYPQGWMVR
jgi:hypothetical protein